MEQFGIWAEDMAAQWLKGKGYKILDSNFRRKWGELDLVAKKEGIVVFVEIKASERSARGFEPESRADSQKMRKVLRTAQAYLISKKYPEDIPWQVDVVSIVLSKERGEVGIKHFKNVEI